MRKSVFLLLLLCLVAAPDAWADDTPPFKVADVAATDEERPEGWSPVLKSGLIPDSAPTVKKLLALSKAAGLEDGSIAARSRSLQKEDGTAAVISVVGFDEKSDAFTTALAEAAVKHGWKVRELASPMRVAVVWSSEAEACKELMTWQAHLTVSKLSQIGVKRANSIQSLADAEQVLAFVSHALKIEPKAGLANSLRGTILFRMRRADDALDPLRNVIAPNAPVPAPPFWQMDAAANVGHILLLKGDDKFLEEAAKALERAVELAEHARRPVEKFGPAYNLACAYSRLGRIDDAFRLLDKSMAIGKAEMGAQWPPNFEHAKVKDPDLQPLRGDPRFDELMKKYDPNPAPEKKEETPSKPDGDGGE